MWNIGVVTKHIREKLEQDGEKRPCSKSLTLLRTQDGEYYHVDEDGDYWRTYYFIEGSRCYEKVQRPAQAYAAAQGIAVFTSNLLDLPIDRIERIIPEFHNTESRYKALHLAIDADPLHRVALAKKEIEFALQREEIASVLVRLQRKGMLTERIVHNDAKSNNILFDEADDQVACVIDLDAVMPGLPLYDFGDMVRDMANSSYEDEEDLSRVFFRADMFEALVQGYLSVAGKFMSAEEISLLPFSARLITLENGVRFLTDYLLGDQYYKTTYAEHNLVRSRTQFHLIRSMELQKDAMAAVVDGLDICERTDQGIAM